MNCNKYIGALAIAAFSLLQGCSRVADTPTIEREVQAISSMKELALVEYRVKKIIKADDGGEWYKIGERKILLSCTAFLKAGVDLSAFGMENIEADRSKGKVTITLPHAKLLSIDIPPAGIKEEYGHVSFFRSEFSAAERNNLMKQGERQIKRTVPSLGILPKAEENGRAFFESVFKKMGFTDIEVVYQ